MAETVQVKSVNQAAIMERVEELTIVAAILQGSDDRLVFPPLQDEDGSIWAALVAIQEKEEVALADLGKLLYYIAGALDNVDNYR